MEDREKFYVIMHEADLRDGKWVLIFDIHLDCQKRMESKYSSRQNNCNAASATAIYDHGEIIQE